MRGVWGVCGVRGSVGRAWKCGTCRGVRVCVLGVCVVYMVWGAWDVRGVRVCGVKRGYHSLRFIIRMKSGHLPRCNILSSLCKVCTTKLCLHLLVGGCHKYRSIRLNEQTLPLSLQCHI